MIVCQSTGPITSDLGLSPKYTTPRSPRQSPAALHWQVRLQRCALRAGRFLCHGEPELRPVLAAPVRLPFTRAFLT
jgi:hypothetical protein